MACGILVRVSPLADWYVSGVLPVLHHGRDVHPAWVNVVTVVLLWLKPLVFSDC
jgi:hypothetical protein